MNDTISIADHAAQQNDRWLFIAALIVLGIVIVAVARYFVAEHSATARDHRQLMADHKTAQETYHKNLADLVERTMPIRLTPKTAMGSGRFGQAHIDERYR